MTHPPEYPVKNEMTLKTSISSWGKKRDKNRIETGVRKMPTPNEIEILSITKEEEAVDKVLISHRMEISLDYAAHLLNYLVRKSLLEEVTVKDGIHRSLPRYKLTRRGAIALLARLHHIASQYESAVRRSVYLKNVIDEKINEMTAYIKEVFPENRNLSIGLKFKDSAESRSRQRKEEKASFDVHLRPS
jgi:hypothetical protein